jgi:sortase A
VETRTTWFVYELREDRIVRPDETWAIDPVPGKPDAKPTERLITLTTCNPRWASTERWVWWGELLEVRAKDAGTSPVEIDGSP